MTTLFKTLSRVLSSALSDRGGAALIVVSLLLPVILGFMGLGVDVGIWYSEKQKLQSLADDAAKAAAFEVQNGTGNWQTAAQREVTRYNTEHARSVAVALTYPYQNSSSSIHVSVSQPITLLFSGVLQSFPTIFTGIESLANGTIAAQATGSSAKITSTGGSACILALHATDSGAIYANGTVTLNATNCVVVANSTSSAAIETKGGGTINALYAKTAGGISVGGQGGVNPTPPYINQTKTTPVTDPFGSRAMPTAAASCDASAASLTGTTTLSPGTYCGIKSQAKSTIHLTPGTYILNGGALDLGGQVTMNCPTCTGGAGVTFYLTGGASVSIAAGASVTLTAPSSGSYAGFLFMQDRATLSSIGSSLVGGSTMTLSGNLYFPNTTLTLTGNTALSDPCTQIVASKLVLKGTSGAGASCGSMGTGSIPVPNVGVIN